MPISVQLAIILLRRAWVCFTILPEREAGMHVKCAMKRRSFSIRVVHDLSSTLLWSMSVELPLSHLQNSFTQG